MGGARPTLFTVTLAMPSGINTGTASRKLTFTAESSQIPASIIGNIGVPYFGRIVNFAGDRTFQPWAVQVVNDEDFVVREAFEAWHSIINTRLGNIRSTPTSSPTFYKADGEVTQYARTGEALRTYSFRGLWPSEIAPIELSWGSHDQIERFSVQFQYDWYDTSGVTGDGGGSI